MLMFFLQSLKIAAQENVHFSIQKIACILFPYTFNKFLLKRI